MILLNISIGLGTEILIGHLIGAGHFEDAYLVRLGAARVVPRAQAGSGTDRYLDLADLRRMAARIDYVLPLA